MEGWSPPGTPPSPSHPSPLPPSGPGSDRQESLQHYLILTNIRYYSLNKSKNLTLDDQRDNIAVTGSLAVGGMTGVEAWQETTY